MLRPASAGVPTPHLRLCASSSSSVLVRLTPNRSALIAIAIIVHFKASSTRSSYGDPGVGVYVGAGVAGLCFILLFLLLLLASGGFSALVHPVPVLPCCRFSAVLPVSVPVSNLAVGVGLLVVHQRARLVGVISHLPVPGAFGDVVPMAEAAASAVSAEGDLVPLQTGAPAVAK
eukprot:CAMPEP_0198131534 /NCGR_PEP_ID=MMETSP1442-20131203/56382_1 /TAXON_ID= /ORGANISM="Craspedostauros australis, Strain CCMP3328" /LENGTH=173 /DNA_ID=CAMNT_0043792367 /DNA_START=142 /DNA_END=660 /DNA_ORIENTATION=-